MKTPFQNRLQTATLVLWFLLAPICATAMARGEAIEILVEDEADPFSKADGTGYANDLVKAAFSAVDVKVIFRVVPYARCKKLALEGVAAACMNMSWDASFEGRIKFSDASLFSLRPTYYESMQHPLKAKSESELGAGVTIGVVRDYEYPPSVMQAKARGAKFDPARSEQNSLKKLAAGRIDTALVMSNDISPEKFWAEDAGVGQQVRLAFHSVTTQNSYIGFSMHHPKGMWALDKFNQGMKIIVANDTIKKIYAKWASANKH